MTDVGVHQRQVEVDPILRASVREVDNGARADRRGRAVVGRRWVVRMIVFIGVIRATTTFLLKPIHGDLRYQLGVKISSVFSATKTFSHRPLAFRLLMDGMSKVAEPLSSASRTFEAFLQLIALGLAITAGILLWRGLSGYAVVAPGLNAIVAVAAFVYMGTRVSLEPDWSAVFTRSPAPEWPSFDVDAWPGPWLCCLAPCLLLRLG